MDSFRAPTRTQWTAVFVATAIMGPLSVWVYSHLGDLFINRQNVLSMVTSRGFRLTQISWFGFYFIPVNAILEELFWRGVVLNELKGATPAAQRFGTAWTAVTFAAWHFLVLRLLLRPMWAEAVLGLIMCAGFFLEWVYERAERITVPILWHALVFDLPLVLIFASVLKHR